MQAPLSSAVQKEVTGIDETVPVMQFQGDATATVSVANNSGKPVIYKKQPNIVFTNEQYFELLQLPMASWFTANINERSVYRSAY